MLKPLQGLLSRREDSLSTGDTILWWERRRLAYNVLLAVAGCFSIAICALTASLANPACGIPDPPFFAGIAIVIYGLAANAMFTGGWICELLLRKRMPTQRFAEISFVTGVCFALFLTLSPSIIVPLSCAAVGAAQQVQIR